MKGYNGWCYMNNRIKAIIIIGSLTFLFSIFLYFMIPIERVTIIWFGMIFILLAEIIFFGGLILIEYISKSVSQVFIRSFGGAAVIVIPIISVAVSMIFMITKSESFNMFIIIQVSLIVILSIIAVIAYYVSLGIKKESDNVLKSVSELNAMIGKLNLLRNDNSNTKYSAMIGKVEDELKYSDISTVVPSDEKLNAKLINLETELLKNDCESKDKKVIGILNDMLTIVKHRKIELQGIKKGGI